MEGIIAQIKQLADEGEVYEVSSEVTEVQFETNRLKNMQTKQTTETALRLIKDGRIGYASTNRPDSDLIEMALETAEFGMPAKFKFPVQAPYPLVEIFDPKVESVKLDEMVKLGEYLINRIMAERPEVICEAGISRGLSTVSLTNTAGTQASYKTSYFSLGVEGTIITGTDMLFVGEHAISCHPLMRPEEITDVVIEQLRRAKDICTVPSRPMPVIFTPRGVANAFIMSLVAALSGKAVLEGASPLANRRGKVVFDKQLWLWDDPTLPHRPSSRPIDDEGVPSQKTLLIDSGKINQFYYDLQTAGLAKAKSTGNGGRHGGLPSPSPSAFIIGTGNASFNDMLADMKEGLVVEDLLGAGQSNVLGGDFSGNVLLGYKVENGKIAGRVKNTIVSGNIYKVLKNIAAIGNESKWVGGMIKTPPIYCQEISVASKT